MKHLFTALILLTFPFLSFADAGSAFVFKVEVKHDQGTLNGYILLVDYFYLDSTNTQQYYASDSLFTDLVRQVYHSDSLQVYGGVYSIDSLNIHVFFKEKGRKIDMKKIISIKLKSIKDAYVGSWVNPDRYSVKDLSWLKKPFLYKEEYSTTGCDITVYYFEKPKVIHPFHKEKIKYLNIDLWNLKDDEFEVWDRILMDYLKLIEEEKVIIRHICGC